MKLPDFLIPGECKSGSSSLYHYLIQHPQILPSYGNGFDAYLGNKEIRFFDRYWKLGAEWYKSRFPKTDPGQLTGEASPEYMSRTLCFYRAKTVLDHKTKMIILIRNPVDRLFSHFYHMVNLIPGWKHKYTSFEDFWYSCREEDYYIIEKGLYHLSIPMWEEAYNTVVIKSEDMFDNSQIIMDGVFEFLGVEPHKFDNFDKLRSSGKPKVMDQDLRDSIMDFYRVHGRLTKLWYK